MNLVEEIEELVSTIKQGNYNKGLLVVCRQTEDPTKLDYLYYALNLTEDELFYLLHSMLYGQGDGEVEH